MNHDFIVRLLMEKEVTLLEELSMVRASLHEFLNEASGSVLQMQNIASPIFEQIAENYDDCQTCHQKVLFILQTERKPMLVEEIVAAMNKFEPGIDIPKFHRTVYCAAFTLVQHKLVKKFRFNRSMKYSI